MKIQNRGGIILLAVVAGIAAWAGAPLAQNAPAGAAPPLPSPVAQGGELFALYPPDSPFLNKARLGEAEQVTIVPGVPGRVERIVNVHNPTIELHRVDRSLNTGAAVIIAPGGGHNSLFIGLEGADQVPYFYNYGVTTVILRYRLRRDGYNAQTDAVYDAQQAIRMVRARAADWGIDPNKIGIMGFSAGAELAAPAAIDYDKFDQANRSPGDPLAGISSRPDFVALIYPGPTPFTREPTTAIPKNAPPTFIASAGRDDLSHAIWADDYFSAMLKARIPNLEMHIYGNGVHGAGMRDRNGIPFGTWPARFIDWFRDLGFLDKPGVETKAARDVVAHVTAPPPAPRGQGRGGRGGAGGPAGTVPNAPRSGGPATPTTP